MTKIPTKHGMIDETKLCVNYSDNGYNDRGGCFRGRCNAQGTCYGVVSSSSMGHKVRCFDYISIADARITKSNKHEILSPRTNIDITKVIKELNTLQKEGHFKDRNKRHRR